VTIGPQESAAAIARLLEQLGRSAYGEGFSVGLNPAQWAALRYFGRANRFSRNLSAFAEYHGTTLGTASQTVRSMVEKGYLRRRVDPRDRRRQHISLSDAGAALLERDPLRVLSAAAEELSAAERQALATGMHRMLSSVAARRGSTCFGVCQNCTYLATGKPQGKACCRLVDETLEPPELAELCVNFEPAVR